MIGSREREAGVRLAALLLLSIPCAAVASEWPQFRGPARDGKSPETGLLKKWPKQGPKLLWKAKGIGDGYSSVVISTTGVYVTGKIGEALALTSFDLGGKRRWRRVHGPAWTENFPGARSTPVIDGKSIYLLSAFGVLKCYNAKSGKVTWTVDIVKTFGASLPRYGYTETPLIHGDRIIVTPGGKNCMVALDKRTGKTVWTSTGLSDPVAHGSAIVFEFGGVEMIVNMTEKGLACVDARNGKFLWRNTRPGGARRVCNSPVYSGGYVFGASGYGCGGACVKLSVKGGRVSAKQVWETKDMDCHHGGYVVVGGRIYGNHKNGWNCLDLKTGKKLWSETLVGKGSISYADGMLYLLAEKGGRVGLAPATAEAPSLVGDFAIAGSKKQRPAAGNLSWRQRMKRGGDNSWAHPSISDGRLYLRYDDNLYVYNIRAR